uniref:Uncharacterized protein n=1 Tax=Marseillevirus LCMAC101 TaxID=2506602 RepID=A0A481YSG7_9VIRU|nr:MAG: uncharacterized protein LCMAC101_02900 [Marseillevirus LCMAC101]
MDDMKKGCFVIILIFSIFFLVYGFMDLMKAKKSGETDAAHISRQIKGFAYIMLSQVVLVIGGALCLGGFEKSLGSLRGAYPGGGAGSF